MAIKLMDVKKATHEEWLEMRKKSIGGSDAGAVMGMNPYSSQITLYAQKKGLVNEIEDNEAMRLGRDLEQYVAERYTEQSGKQVRNDNFMYQHCMYPFITANIDRRIVGENAGLECKTMSSFNGYNFEAGEIPGHYYCQCQHYMMVMGFDYMDLAILVFQKGVFIIHIERNEDFITELLRSEVDFWENYIMTDTIPAPDGSDASLETLKELYPHEVKESKIEIVGLDQMITDYRALSDLAKEYEQRKNALQAQICSLLGDHEVGEGDAFGCSWKTQSRASLDNQRLKADLPDVYEKYLNVSEYRVFRTKKMRK